MGGGSYNHSDRAARTQMFSQQSRSEIFSKKFHEDMNPKGVTLRESRDSENHPLSLPIIFGLDVTGSMGFIPEQIIKRDLPHIIAGLQKAGIADPQIMFLAIGDHITDQAPLQISQFESGDAELDMWLQRVWLEGGGGGNGGESYPLAHYFAAKVCKTDHWEKRGKKGFLFTIGDERFHKDYSANAIKSLMGTAEAKTYTAAELLKDAQEQWNVFHILPGMVKDNSDQQWKEALGERAMNVQPEDIATVITNTIVNFADIKTSDKHTPHPELEHIEHKPEEDKKFL